MLGLTPLYRQFQSLKTKEALKEALIKRPKSIQSLKKSLCINHTNLDDFVKYIKEPPVAFHSSYRNKTEEDEHQLIAEVNGLKNIAKNLQVKPPPNKEIFLKRNSMKSKKRKKELKVQRSDLKFAAEAQSEQNSFGKMFYRGKTNYGFESFKKKKIAGLENKSSKNSTENTHRKKYMELRNTFSDCMFKYEGDQNISNSCKFWRKADKSQSSHQRWKTEVDEKTGDKSLGEMTKFCSKKNMKGVNYLVLQLQLNIEGSKRMRKTIGAQQ